MPATATSGETYSTLVGLIYVFNLIVGTGALTLPSAFNRAGWLLGLIVIIILACMSYVTATFIVESMASANAIRKWQRLKDSTDNETSEEREAEEAPLFEQDFSSDAYPLLPSNLFCIEEKIELGQMAVMFFNKWGQVLFYICIVLYLYGDLAIYGAAIAKSLTNVACTLTITNGSVNISVPDSAPCWTPGGYSRMSMYRIFLGVFVLTVGPLAFFNIQKTKYLQLFTSIMRWSAFTLMIGIAVHFLITEGNQSYPPLAALSGVPALFGACVYSFMCHHSLPGLLTPIADKSRLYLALASDYLLVAAFYLLLAFTGVFAFSQLEDLYTLVFWRQGKIAGYFLTLFPVFTLSTNFPILAVTLRSNLEALCPNCASQTLRTIMFPILAIFPPVVVAMMTTDLSILVGITGIYAGVGVQYIIPTFLVGAARKRSHIFLKMSSTESKFASPFKGNLWLIFVLTWSVTCVILVTVNLIEKLSGKL